MPSVDLEKLKVLSRFLAEAPSRPDLSQRPGSERIDRPFESQGAHRPEPPSRFREPMARIPIGELHAMLRERTCVEEALEAIGEDGTRTSVVHILPILVDGTSSERSAAMRAIESILGREGGTLGDGTLDSAVRALLRRLEER